ncbi:MAG: IS66 family transposase zinc-finger binding domain-containing protein [Gammaproteobacteria bacterium]|nr:IS66 family transposase zinc-finger binding domain-containing protein [Gammaproteobacteria bacterium]
MIDLANDACPCCGGLLHSIGENVSEMLDWVPAQLRVLRITRPNTRAGPTDRRWAGDAGVARPGAGRRILRPHSTLLATQIFARRGVELERSTLAGWVGGAWGGPAPPAAVYIFAPDRRGPSAQTTRGDVVLAACRAHMRRKFHEALRGITGLSAVEVQVRGKRCH